MKEFGTPKSLMTILEVWLNGTSCKAHIGGQVSESLHIKNGMKEGDALSQQLFNFIFELITRKIYENRKELIFNGLNQIILVFEDFLGYVKDNT